MTREITGWHVAAMFVTGFGIIIAVNLTLAVNAVRTFPGLEVKNSYVASQSFDEDRAAQTALGWEAEVTRDGDRIRLALDTPTGPAPALIRDARLGRTTHTGADRQLSFAVEGQGWSADAPGLDPGAWYLWLTAEAPDGTAFRRRFSIWVAK